MFKRSNNLKAIKNENPVYLNQYTKHSVGMKKFIYF